MVNKKEYLIKLIFNKLTNNNSRKIDLEKKELTKFINLLINKNKY